MPLGVGPLGDLASLLIGDGAHDCRHISGVPTAPVGKRLTQQSVIQAALDWLNCDELAVKVGQVKAAKFRSQLRADVLCLPLPLPRPFIAQG